MQPYCHTAILPYYYTAILQYCHTFILPDCDTESPQVMDYQGQLARQESARATVSRTRNNRSA